MSAPVSTLFPGFCDRDYEFFSQKVQKHFGLRLCDYKSDQMRRRIATLAVQMRCDSYMSYFGLLERDSSALGAFLDHVTINVTELLRNPKIFESLTRHWQPMLESSKAGTFNVWSAGCSYGAEAYSVALLLSEAQLGRPARVRGTDIDLAVLAKANGPSFSQADMVNVSPERRKAFFASVDGVTHMPNAKLRSLVQFSRHDLLADPYPTEEYDLIVCRNVLIYFTNEAKNRIYSGMIGALKPGGIMFVGGTESIADHVSFGFEIIEPFFYRKPAVGARAKLRAAA